MKTVVLLLTLAMSCLLSYLSAFAEENPPADCTKYHGTSRYETCQHAREFGLSLNAAAIVEGLAERTYAVELCGGTIDPAEQRHTESILAGSTRFRDLYNAHLLMLGHRCIYDPDGWCQERGFNRR